MQDIRALAAALEQHRTDPDLRTLAHACIRGYAVELLVSLSHAINPSNESEAAAVAWLRQEIIQIAAQIPEAKGPSS